MDDASLLTESDVVDVVVVYSHLLLEVMGETKAVTTSCR